MELVERADCGVGGCVYDYFGCAWVDACYGEIVGVVPCEDWGIGVRWRGGEGGGVKRDEPLWPKREVSGTAPRTAKDGVVKNVRIAAGVAGIVDGVLLFSRD